MNTILKFINTHENWEDVLGRAPYNLTIRRDADYVLLKYHQFSSDFSEQMVREARGFIMRKEGRKYKIVCAPFTKFFAAGDPNAKRDLFKLAHRKQWLVQEKIDGSLIKVWFDRGTWHVSTNGTINAANAHADIGVAYLDLFKELEHDIKFEELYKDYTYMFELVGPKNKLVVPYEDAALYYLGRKHNVTLQDTPYYEDDCSGVKSCKRPRCDRLYIEHPKDALRALKRAVNELTRDDINFEGYVITDEHCKYRVKLKSNTYMELFHTKKKGPLTDKRALKYIMEGCDDDIVGESPEWAPVFKRVKADLMSFINKVQRDLAYAAQQEWPSKKEFALWAKEQTCPKLLFRNYNAGAQTTEDIFEQLKDIILKGGEK